MKLGAKLFYRIARSHMYWGRKPIVGLLQLFDESRRGTVLDPFCGAGSPAVAALIKGARVIATELNPMGSFLTRTLVRPLSIPGVVSAFERVHLEVAPKASAAYAVPCPDCGKPATIDYVVWQEETMGSRPTSAQIECQFCGRSGLRKLSLGEQERQFRASHMKPGHWYPKTCIHYTSRKLPAPSHDRLFTGRNLSVLAELFEAIRKIEEPNYREALQYVFTAALYSCSEMQMFSEKDPSSSRGWTALRFYIPGLRKETNVLRAFSRRFKTFLACKQEMNTLLPHVRVTQDMTVLAEENAGILVQEMSWRDSVKKFGPQATHIFLDPPYDEDVDYFDFSEFWGAWLSMRFDFQSEWCPKREKRTGIRQLLSAAAESTRSNCRVTLAFDPKRPEGWDIEGAIESSAYRVASTGCFLYDNSYKRGKDLQRRKDRYYVLEKVCGSQGHTESKSMPVPTKKDTYPYLRVATFMLEEDREKNLNNRPSASAESIRAKTSNEFLPVRLRDLGAQLDKDEIKQQVENSKRNTQAYHSFCLALTAIMLQQDAWEVVYANPAEFEEGAFDKHKDRITPESTDYGAAAFVARKADREILFFFEDQEANRLRRAARQISKQDRNEYKRIAVLILPSARKMGQWRAASRADGWPRGFFIPLDEMREKCQETAPEPYGVLCSPIARTVESAEPENRAAMFTAEVQQNVPVGGERASHYKLRFGASGLTSIMPGQFIMMDTLSRNPRKSRGPVSWDVFRLSYRRAPQTYLKRPFGVHRAFYPHFGKDYLRLLALPRALATVMHTVLPNAFDIFYKVLPNGKGTQEMSQLRPRTTVNMIGPLGRRFDLRQEVSKGLKEVHVIGGGVGMAPLIFLVQSLRYFGISVKAFIGIESVDLLKYRGDHIDEGFAAGAKDAYIYVDDLKEAGVDRSDIYVSCDKKSDVRELVPESNYRTGLVSQQYEEFLSTNPKRNHVVAFACGPIPMMSAVNNIAKTHGVYLRVFMEKRMACGIGVCLSCVCKTTAPGSGYSRVCKEGPIFEASEIIWD